MLMVSALITAMKLTRRLDRGALVETASARMKKRGWGLDGAAIAILFASSNWPSATGIALIA